MAEESRAHGVYVEGSVSREQVDFLATLTAPTPFRRIAEIGFNAGFSSYTLLSANPDARVTSFDLVEHEYVGAAKAYIDEVFPGRHTLIPGDSRHTVVTHGEAAPLFDLVFIDGGHTYEVASADIRNMRARSDANTVVVFDDLLPHKPWGAGPVQAWREAIEQGLVTQTALFEDGVEVESVGPEGSRAWAVGRYVIDARTA